MLEITAMREIEKDYIKSLRKQLNNVIKATHGLGKWRKPDFGKDITLTERRTVKEKAIAEISAEKKATDQ